jgi:hypothetical protein
VPSINVQMLILPPLNNVAGFSIIQMHAPSLFSGEASRMLKYSIALQLFVVYVVTDSRLIREEK